MNTRPRSASANLALRYFMSISMPGHTTSQGEESMRGIESFTEDISAEEIVPCFTPEDA